MQQTTADERKTEREENAYQTWRRSRRGRRAALRARLSRQRKHNAAFQRTKRQEEFARQTTAAQLAVLEAGPEHPMYRSVYNALVVKHGDELPA